MKRISLILLIVISFFSFNYVIAPNEGTYDLFLKFAKLYNSGDLVNAEKCMLLVLESKESMSEDYLVAAYNNLGATNTLLGKYKKALEYYILAETHIAKKEQSPLSLADIYINKAIIYNFQRSFTQAIEYYEKGIRICQGIGNPDRNVLHSISTAYLNIGIIYYKIKDYKNALRYFEKSADLKNRFKLSKIALTYFNIAKTYSKTENPKKAEEFFLKSIDSFNNEFGEDYFRKAELFFDYGLFLESIGRASEALEVFKKALSICTKSYGDKHPFVSLSYKYLGDYFVNQNDYDSALVYYQKALIAIVTDFNDPDINANPSINSSLYDIRFLEILKSKSQALELLAMKQKNLELKLVYIKKSFEAIDLALQLIRKLRKDYITEESRIYLADNEKETYVFATEILTKLYSLTRDPALVEKMYNITRQSKATVLQDEISDNNLFYSIHIADSIQKKHNNLLLDIGAYSNLIQEENRKPNPDKTKINFWEDNLFEMKRVNEKLEDNINKQFPQYRDLLNKTEPISIKEIQSYLKNDETLVEYFLSNKYKYGKRKLYIFRVTANNLNFIESDLDSLFKKDAEIIRQGTVQSQSPKNPHITYGDYTSALFNMYDKLIKPVEDHVTGNRLIIVPDEEIAFLPFDAFLKTRPDSTKINYDGLQYLIYYFTFSYGYSSSHIFNNRNQLTKEVEIYAFSPFNLNKTNNSGKDSDYLAGATKEISSISSWFHCEKFLGSRSTKTNFKAVIQDSGILHLAMHSVEDPDNSKYSYLMFNNKVDTLEEEKLFNYEISLYTIRSPMVVLSACNTGTGTLYHGEGIMSLARGFILAGALSVVMTYWDVNDEASAAVITQFYYQLSRGRKKDDAMRFAKLEYLKTQPPLYSNPYYWAGYEVLGDNGPLVPQKLNSILLILVVIFLFAGFLIIYFRWRSILSARSR